MPPHLLNLRVDELVEALMDQWFVDPEGHKLADFVNHSVEYRTVMNDIVRELQESVHRLISNTVGTLVPSLRYQYEIQQGGEVLLIIPTLPTFEDYDQRIRAMATDDSGWVPARYRR